MKYFFLFALTAFLAAHPYRAFAVDDYTDMLGGMKWRNTGERMVNTRTNSRSINYDTVLKNKTRETWFRDRDPARQDFERASNDRQRWLRSRDRDDHSMKGSSGWSAEFWNKKVAESTQYMEDSQKKYQNLSNIDKSKDPLISGSRKADNNISGQFGKRFNNRSRW